MSELIPTITIKRTCGVCYWDMLCDSQYATEYHPLMPFILHGRCVNKDCRQYDVCLPLVHPEAK